jgi:hypothetical protein
MNILPRKKAIDLIREYQSKSKLKSMVSADIKGRMNKKSEI